MSATLQLVGNAKAASAMVHDWHCAKLTTSMVLICEMLDTVAASWRRGQVMMTLKDSATEYSTAICHVT